MRQTRLILAIIMMLLITAGCAQTGGSSSKSGGMWSIDGASRPAKKELPLESGWLEYKQSPGVVKTGALDFSWLNEAPAGKRGHVLVSGGDFVFEDGTPVRFFGVNLAFAAATPDKKVAEAMAAELASMGVNLVRLHGIDCSYSGIVDYTSGEGPVLNEVNLDKLDYLVYCLKQKGIYIHLDTNAGRILTEESGFSPAEIEYASGGTLRAGHFFDERIVELETKFIRDYLTHVNPYTKMSYATDPVVAVIQYVNESSITWFNNYNENNVFSAGFKTRFNEWLLEKYGSRAKLKSAWTNADGQCALKSGEDPAKGTVSCSTIGGWGEMKVNWAEGYDSVDCAPRYADFMEFLMEIQTKVFTSAYGMIRGLGYKSAINCSNQPEAAVDNKLNALGDIMEKNAYWNHPTGGYTLPATFPVKEMTSINPKEMYTVMSVIARAAVADKPMVVTEWNATTPTTFKADVIFQLVSYASLQDWDGFCLFTYTFQGDEDFFYLTNSYTSFFNSNCDPSMWGQFGMASAIFRLGLVKEAENTIEYVLTDEDVLAGGGDYHKIPSYSVYLSKFAIRFIGNKYNGDADLVISSGNTAGGDYTKAKNLILHSDNPFSDARQKTKNREAWLGVHKAAGMKAESIGGVQALLGSGRLIITKEVKSGFMGRGAIDEIITGAMRSFKLIDSGEGWFEDKVVSDTKQITYNFGEKLFTLDTDRAAVVAGNMAGSRKLGGCSIDTENDLAAVAVFSPESKKISQADRLLVYAMGRCVNYGMEWEENTLTSLGEGPVIYEDVRGTLVIPSDKSKCTVWGLDYTGARKKELPVSKSGDAFKVTLGGFCNYEVVFE